MKDELSVRGNRDNIVEVFLDILLFTCLGQAESHEEAVGFVSFCVLDVAVHVVHGLVLDALPVLAHLVDVAA